MCLPTEKTSDLCEFTGLRPAPAPLTMQLKRNGQMYRSLRSVNVCRLFRNLFPHPESLSQTLGLRIPEVSSSAKKMRVGLTSPWLTDFSCRKEKTLIRSMEILSISRTEKCFLLIWLRCMISFLRLRGKYSYSKRTVKSEPHMALELRLIFSKI